MSSRATVGCKTGVLVALAGLVLVGGPAAPDSAPALGATAPSKAPPLPHVTRFSLPDLTGRQHSPAEWRGHKAVVLIFLGTECPVSNGYAPVLARLARAYQPRGVAFYGIHADPDVTA